jgi:hypothetical protein
LASVFKSYPTEAGRRVIDPMRGLPSKCKFLPSVAETVEAIKAEADVIAKLSEPSGPDGEPRPRMVLERRISKPFMPYPKLWDALEGEPDMLKALKAETFDGMTAMSKLFATEGIDRVRDKLRPIAVAPARHKGEAA